MGSLKRLVRISTQPWWKNFMCPGQNKRPGLLNHSIKTGRKVGFAINFREFCDFYEKSNCLTIFVAFIVFFNKCPG